MSARRPPTAAESFATYSSEERLRALRYYFGLADADAGSLGGLTGLTPDDIEHREHGPEPLNDGFSAVRTCSLDWRRDTLAPQYQGNWPYWRDVIAGFWVTGSLDRLDPRYPANRGT